ncbi:phosphotriesterase family protein [Planococcus shenhongbingii]|uniref:Phosphotriesterase-related protein n=1 Tax=Planococcus shenhongbingii TaxID=3058398 RepID=A0ABT8NI74_9BACL|nr:phosphotriesterase-related protein [Planococcus sp. N017]MDN7247357.1 phosphotriesterase-related protein [Planococcus sp. N017]
MTKRVETVTGTIVPEAMGKTLIHEHFIFGYPGFQGDITLGPFNREKAIATGVEAAKKMMAHGVQTVVDPTPNECGRDPEILEEISRQSGLQIICATGYYYEGEGATPYFKFRASLGSAEQEINEMFLAEIKEGIGGTSIKPGIIKLASSRDVITDYEKMFFRAAARAQQETGITLLTHTQEGTMGPEQAQFLLELGADPAGIVIGHMCGNTDAAYHKRTLETGVYISFDRFGLQGIVGAPLDWQRIETLLELLDAGFEDRIMLSHDSISTWLGRPPVIPEPVQPAVANWHPTHLFENVVPELKKGGVTESQINKMFTDNARKLFAAETAAV